MSLMLNSIGAQYEIFWGPDAWTDWFNTTVAEIDSRGYLGEFESNSYGPDRSRLRWKLACLVGHQNMCVLLSVHNLPFYKYVSLGLK